MSEIASAIGPIAGLGTSAAGLYSAFQNQQYAQKVRNLTSNPEAMQAYINGFKQPLVAGLQQGVANQAQAEAAERGLSTSPGQFSQIESQAIAPYLQQQQNTATQNALQSLGLGQSTVNPNAGTGALGSLQYALKGLGGLGTASPASLGAAQQYNLGSVAPPTGADAGGGSSIDWSNLGTFGGGGW